MSETQKLQPTAKKILYLDMDNTLVDFPSAFPHVDPALLEKHAEHKDDIPGIFALMQPMPGAIDAVHELAPLCKKVILSHHTHLNRGEFLVDDGIDHNGVDRFHEHGVEVIRFGPEGTHTTWPEVVHYLKERA